MVLPVRMRIHWGSGRFCFCFFPRIFLILKVLLDGCVDIRTIVARRLRALNRVARVAPGHHERLARTRDRASRAPTSARPWSPRTSAPSPRARVRVIERPCTALHRARVVDVVARTILSVAKRRRARCARAVEVERRAM
ncbi:hypothetical protein BE221DRAFT_118111 [Ostreococcus tauri]|uniref:Uncharacterized protein n=1 Tax=Ostreococcus tauri TaxID=70448 RepID=A0A1Y5I5E8_OSTTA|nr:hypothetical protein BE221DRAFT_118111 [Ostreococcus tauri]